VEIAIDDSSDVEIAEIGRDEEWVCVLQAGTDPLATVKATRTNSGSVYLRAVAESCWGMDGKAIATLPGLVRQRDRLLEASKAVGQWLTDYPKTGAQRDLETWNCIVQGGTGPPLAGMYHTLLEAIAEIEKNPLIRLTDGE
jgi:hypothetical protein